MAAQPARNAVGVTIRQEIDYGVALEVNDHGPVAPTAAPGPLVEADDAWGAIRRHGRGAHEAQQRVRAHRHGKPLSQAGRGFAAER